jgi:hypothetical protein
LKDKIKKKTKNKIKLMKGGIEKKKVKKQYGKPLKNLFRLKKKKNSYDIFFVNIKASTY